jgi:cytochrome P450
MPESETIEPLDFPFHAPAPYEPAPEYAKLREQGPLARVKLPTGHLAWVAYSYDAVRTIAVDPNFSKHAVTLPDAPRLLPIAKGSQSMVTMDAPEHTRLRRLVSRDFTPRRIQLLRPRIEEVCEQLVDALCAGGETADAVTALALPLPITVICELLGVPVEEQEQFRDTGDRFMSVARPGADPEEGPRAAGALFGYLGRLVGRKRTVPGEDLLTALLKARDEEDALDEEELLAFGVTLLVAGYHTTASSIAHALFHLLDRPERYAKLAADPGLVPGAVDELLRYSQVGGGFGSMRIALADTEVCGVKIAKGDPVVPAFAVANRDPGAFERPDELDLSRPTAAHLAFGAGIHFCLGAQLARMELEVLLGTLIRRVPDLRLTQPSDSLEWITRVAFPRPAALPVAW